MNGNGSHNVIIYDNDLRNDNDDDHGDDKADYYDDNLDVIDDASDVHRGDGSQTATAIADCNM